MKMLKELIPLLATSDNGVVYLCGGKDNTVLEVIQVSGDRLDSSENNCKTINYTPSKNILEAIFKMGVKGYKPLGFIITNPCNWGGLLSSDLVYNHENYTFKRSISLNSFYQNICLHYPTLFCGLCHGSNFTLVKKGILGMRKVPLKFIEKGVSKNAKEKS